jgi:hypothetical protein
MTPEEFAKEMHRRAELVHSNLGQAVVNSCQLIENTAKGGMRKTEIDTSKSYPRQSGNKVHHPSMEGSYPAIDYGPLIQSVTHDAEQNGNEVIGRVGSNQKEGIYTELGTSRMAARPWLKPSVEKNKEKIHKLFKNAVVGQSPDFGDVETAEE